MSNNPFLELEQKILGDIFTSTQTIDNLAVLCDEFGSRFGGTPGEKQAAEFLQKKMVEFGLKNVHAEPFEYLGWRRGKATFEITHPIQKAIKCIALPHCPTADIECLIINMGDGAPADFATQAHEIEGKIVLTNSKVSPKGSKRWIHRKEKLGRALMAGAAGFIFVNHYPGYGPATGGIGHNGQSSLIPGISVSYEDGTFIQRLIKSKGEVRARLVTDCVNETMTSWNIIGELPGSTNSDTIVMLGCHYDGHDISQGAQDPASGAVALLEAARNLAKYTKNLPCTLRFAFWGVEEIGLIGSKEYVKSHLNEMDKIRFYLNMDAAGAISEKAIVLNEWESLQPLFEGWKNHMALEFGIRQSISAHSDHFPFLKAGVPTGGIERAEANLSGRGYGHTQYDTLDKVNLQDLQEAAALASRIALRIASEDKWPVGRRNQEKLDEIFNTPEYKEEEKFASDMNQYYENYRNK